MASKARKPYTLGFRPGAQRQWKRLKKSETLRTAQSIGLAIADLTKDPYPPGHEPIKSKEKLRRIRIGEFRVAYLVDDKRWHITITAIGHRKEIYRWL